MARRTYTEQDRARVAVALATNDGNVKRTARETGVPEQTVRDWKKQWDRGGLPAKVESEVPALVDEFLEKAERVRNKALVQLEAAIDEGRLKPRELTTAIGVLTDKVTALKNSGRAGRGDTNVNIINLPTPKEFREQIADYVTTIVSNAKERDELIVEATDAEWEQAERKALPPA